MDPMEKEKIENNVRLCINCKHCVSKYHTQSQNSLFYCTYHTNVVTGEKHFILTEKMRYATFEFITIPDHLKIKSCKHEGLFFENKNE